jgi:hypothetical protein
MSNQRQNQSTLNATQKAVEALRQRQAAAARTAAQQELERAERDATRSRIREVIASVAADEVQEVERGPVRMLARDGLLWLVSQNRLSPHLRQAGERYRALYRVSSGGDLRSCLAEMRGRPAPEILASGTLADGDRWRLDARDGAASARSRAYLMLEKAHADALNHDGALIWLVGEVAGKGSTLRDLARGDKHTAGMLEVELNVALRLLARHFGMAT